MKSMAICEHQYIYMNELFEECVDKHKPFLIYFCPSGIFTGFKICLPTYPTV